MYNYSQQKSRLFTDEGTRMFLKIRDNANRLLENELSVSLSDIICGTTGDSWDMLACVDRLVEIGELRETTIDRSCWAQHRTFTKSA